MNDQTPTGHTLTDTERETLRLTDEEQISAHEAMQEGEWQWFHWLYVRKIERILAARGGNTDNTHVVHVTATPVAEDVVWCDDCEEWVTAGAPEGATGDTDREALGRLVREVWVEWAHEQPNPKPTWLVGWDDLPEPDREVDRRIGERLARAGDTDLRARVTALAQGWDERLRREHGVGEDFTDWHSRELRALLDG